MQNSREVLELIMMSGMITQEKIIHSVRGFTKTIYVHIWTMSLNIFKIKGFWFHTFIFKHVINASALEVRGIWIK